MYKQDSGTVQIGDAHVYDNIDVKKRVGYIADDLYFFGNHSLNGLKSFYKGLYKSWNGERYKELVGLFGLDPKRPTRKFSKGMQKQAAFIFSMSIMPEVLLLDEPIDGLDPLIRSHVKSYIIKDVAATGMTVLLSSHNLKEIEDVCDSVGIVKAGRMVVERDLDDLKSGLFKFQVAFAPEVVVGKEKYKAAGLDVLHYEKRDNSSIEMIIARGTEADGMARIKTLNPLLCEALPITLDEIFIYETEGAGNGVN
jgi:ABC-2 type transport system ATP-binding protein